MLQSPLSGSAPSLATGAEADGVGHRARLLARFDSNGLSALHPHEIVELLLTFAIPRKDTKPLAKDLLRRFGSLTGVLHASAQQLQEVSGMGTRTASLLSLVREVSATCLREKFDRKRLVHHRTDVDEYLRFHLGPRQTEYVAALFLDNTHCVLGVEILAEGTANQCAVYPRSVVEKALTYKASSFVLAHNHPGGSKEPSAADWQLTKRLCEIGALLDMPMIDHVIIARDGVVSLRERPLWPR
jgi:DNA repair protein RadC